MKTETIRLGLLAFFGILAVILAGVFSVVRVSGPSAGLIAVTNAVVTSGVHGMLDLYKMHVGHYPARLQELEFRPSNAADAVKWKGPYVKPGNAILLDAWGDPLFYRTPGVHNPNTYDLWSAGPDGQSGTGDDITNWTGAAALPTSQATTRPLPGAVPSDNQP
jgi:general secretion pathway protein G